MLGGAFVCDFDRDGRLDFFLPNWFLNERSLLLRNETPSGNWLDVGVGICSGEEYVGNVGGGGFKDFTALGDVTNTAARLQAETKGGEVMLCASTYAAAVDSCAGAEPRQLSLRGKTEPVDGYLLRVS